MIFLSLGSNLGDKYANLMFALYELSKHPHIWIRKKSFIYESKPMYMHDQPNYYNMVVEIDTNLEPLDLLNHIKKIEIKSGRTTSKIKNMPRTLDIDILAIDDLLIRSEVLNIPHMHIKERRFVLKPWLDIAPSYILPGEKKSISYLLKNTSDMSKLNLILETEEN